MEFLLRDHELTQALDRDSKMFDHVGCAVAKELFRVQVECEVGESPTPPNQRLQSDGTFRFTPGATAEPQIVV